MAKEIINTGGPQTVPLSPAVRAGDFIFVSGQVPADLKTGQLYTGDLKVQTRIVLERIQFILESCGASLQDVVKTTVFLTDNRNFAAMNEVYREFFPSDQPARSCVEVKLACPAGIEIEAVAYAPRSSAR